MKRIYFTTTNDLTYDQRMIRICRSLAVAGYSVVLIGRRQAGSLPLREERFGQRRLSCLFRRGKLFYVEFNIRLFWHLLFRKMDGICAVDLDTILPCLFVARLKGVVRIYDAHELFSEMKEVLSRPFVRKVWRRVERYAVPQFRHGYTVSQSIAEEFRRRYGVEYEVIRNVPVREVSGEGVSGEWSVVRDEREVSGEWSVVSEVGDVGKTGISEISGVREVGDVGKTGIPGILAGERYILYQGAVNEARGLEFLIPAMRKVDCRLLICGEGNLLEECRELVRRHGLEGKVIFAGPVPPEQLRAITEGAWLGMNLVEPFGLNALYSLANKFFDYMHAALPQVTMDFPEYRRINEIYAVGLLIDETREEKIAAAINNLLTNDVLYRMLRDNCKKARLLYNWQEEEKTLLRYYQKMLN